ncbi:MAG: hypothetical protein KAI89_08775 [Emcibacter sp.]|nr:hypothetical protein [Emcibacter sp.]
MDVKFFRKGTLLIPSGTGFDTDKKHLFVICNDTCTDGMNLIVPLVTWKNSYSDDTCVLNVGDHPFIKHRSYIQYRFTRLVTAEDLMVGINNNAFTRHSDFMEFYFLKIKNGIVRSKQTPRQFKKYAYDVIGISQPHSEF